MFYITFAYADIRSVKSFLTSLISICVVTHAGKIETELYGSNYTEVLGFWQKWLTIYDKVDAILKNISVTDTNVDGKLFIWKQPSFSVLKSQPGLKSQSGFQKTDSCWFVYQMRMNLANYKSKYECYQNQTKTSTGNHGLQYNFSL